MLCKAVTETKFWGAKITSKITSTRCQFHQHKRTNFSYERRFFTYMYLEKSCQNDISYEKFVRKLLMKLTVGEIANSNEKNLVI